MTLREMMEGNWQEKQRICTKYNFFNLSHVETHRLKIRRNLTPEISEVALILSGFHKQSDSTFEIANHYRQNMNPSSLVKIASP